MRNVLLIFQIVLNTIIVIYKINVKNVETHLFYLMMPLLALNQFYIVTQLELNKKFKKITNVINV